MEGPTPEQWRSICRGVGRIKHGIDYEPPENAGLATYSELLAELTDFVESKQDEIGNLTMALDDAHSVLADC